MNDRGYLTSEEQARVGRESLPVLKSISAQLLALAHEIFTKRVPYEPTNGADVMSLSFVTKQCEHLRSVELLIDANAHRDAGLIARTMLEGQIMLSWAFQDIPARTDLWFWFGAIADWRQTLKNENAGRPVDSEEKRQLREFVDQYGPDYFSGKVRKRLRESEATGVPYQMPDDPWGNAWTEMSAASMFAAVGATNLYESLYRSTSGWAHWDPRGINLAFERTEWGMAGFADFDWTGASRALVTGCGALLSSLELLDGHFSLGRASRLAELRESMTKSLNALLSMRPDMGLA